MKATGHSRGYAFITYEYEEDFREAWHKTNRMTIDDRTILVEYERSRIQKGWIPRRLGGGLGGKKESGQLRFGGRDRPFQVPITTPEFNPLSVPGTVHKSKIGVVAAIKNENGKEKVIYMKQIGGKIKTTQI
eukprot:TRINITY_DN3720_c0_g1_i10.p2 TRINITY_DN3720_c0_g1~~TRINITY_DN3720_c0_g1_i10.p2  ORF type:complete len:132 (-),score=27.31 TRINITY_DN3720_c0_g1_i10:22-417(-)